MESLFHEEKHITDKCAQAILITGIARGGTTALGEILHSMKDVEYLFEPPMLFGLFPLIEKMPEACWRMLYQTYLYEEFLMDALAGRKLNFNPYDDSFIYKAKTENDIKERLSRSWRKVELDAAAKKSTIAFKMPDIAAYLPTFLSYFPKTRVIILNRDANDVFHSMQKKGWFTDEALTRHNRLWPTTEHKGFRVPHFIPKEDHAAFVGMTEIERIAHYYIIVNSAGREVRGAIALSYDVWVHDPVGVTTKLASMLGLTFGDKTDALLQEVAAFGKREKKSGEDLLALLPEATRRKVESLSPTATL